MLNDELIRPLSQPLAADGGICVVRGNLALRCAWSAAAARRLRARPW